MAQVASRGRLIHGMAQKPGIGDFDGWDSRAAILRHTPPWKSGGISGCTFQEANFRLSSSSIPGKTPHSEKTLTFFPEGFAGRRGFNLGERNTRPQNFDTNENNY